MKTASKLLSMLLLVAMCLSLMGGSAYALSLEPASGDLALGLPEASSTFDLNLGGSAVVPEGSTTLELEKPGTFNGTKNIWNGLYPDLNTAAQNTTDIKLHDDAPASVNDLGGTISRNVIIDLNGKTLTLTAPLAVNANITIKNGTLVNADLITVGKGYKVTFSGVDTQGKNVSGEGESAETKDYIATIGGEKFATMQAAFEYAAKQSGTVTITVIDDASKLKDYPIGTMPATMSCDAIVLNLGKNCLTGTLDAKVPFTINGGTISGSINANSNVTLNSTEVTGKVAVEGKTLTVNSSKVGSVELAGGTLVMGSGSEIAALAVNDDFGGQSILKVSGGKVKNFVLHAGSAYRAITGGEWYVVSDGGVSLEYLKNCVADGLTLKGTENPYTVGSGAGNGGSGVVTGDFTVYGSPYTKGSGNTVYVLMPYTSSTGNYYWSTVSNPASTSQISTISSGYCSVISSGSQYKLTLSNSFLDGLSSGTIYLWTGHDGKYTYMGSLTINGSGTIVEPGDVALWPVDSNEWYSGDGMLAFYYRPAIDFSDPAKKGLWIDGWLQDPTNWITNNNNGLLKIGTAILNNLSRGWHTVSVNTVDGVASCQFYVGATLRPVDTDKHVTGSSKNLQFVCSDPIQSVWVGGRQLTDVDYGDYWTLSSSRKTVTLTAKFLNNRTAGETYTIGVVTDNGDKPSCTFQILTTAQASASPKTGDESNLALWAAVLILSGGAAVAVLPRLKKHEN